MDEQYETEEVTIEYRCGHSETRPIRKYKQAWRRAKKLAELAEMLCRACFVRETIRDYRLKPLCMSYSNYKRHYRNCLVDRDSYNVESKMITVYVRQEHKQDDVLFSCLMNECGITEEQAEFFMDVAREYNFYILEKWFAITPVEEGFRKALTMVIENNPSYKFCERHWRHEKEKEEENGRHDDFDLEFVSTDEDSPF